MRSIFETHFTPSCSTPFTKMVVRSGIPRMSTETVKLLSENGLCAILRLFCSKCIFMDVFRFKRTGKRNEIFLATKFGMGPTKASGRVVDGRPEYVPQVAEESLTRLGVDYIDLYYLHRYVV